MKTQTVLGVTPNIKVVTLSLVQKLLDGLLSINQTKNTHNLHEINLCKNLLKNEQWPIDKISRWFGFIQGTVVERGYTSFNFEKLYTLNAMKDIYDCNFEVFENILDIYDETVKK